LDEEDLVRLTRLTISCIAPLALLCASALAQDVPLGDLVRQQKQQKDQAAKNDPAAAKPSKVITDSDLPEHPGGSASLPKHLATTTGPTASNFAKSAEVWKAQITGQKNTVATLQLQMTQLSESIHFASGCVYDCVAWNERQKQKMDQVDRLKLQLDEANKKLETMQEAARRQGYGSSVY
jgi:hypothetical protein